MRTADVEPQIAQINYMPDDYTPYQDYYASYTAAVASTSDSVRLRALDYVVTLFHRRLSSMSTMRALHNRLMEDIWRQRRQDASNNLRTPAQLRLSNVTAK